MQFVRRFRIPALFCTIAVLLCELVARPYTSMGIWDDGPYILMARTLASTGHIVYNGWAAAMIFAQLYLGAAFVKLFGFSFTAVRMSTLLIAMLTAFLLQRTLVRAGITERNATFGTLALVLSPLYLLLSVTFMSDIIGLSAIVLCVYGCLRALQATADRSAAAWLVFAVGTNVFLGTSRQISWLGTLVMVPSALWILRDRRRVLIAGAVFNVAGVMVIFACLQWLKHQRYVISVPLFTKGYHWAESLGQIVLLLLDIPFLLLPIAALFLPQVRWRRPYVVALVSVLVLSFLAVAIYPSDLRPYFNPLLEPTSSSGSWITKSAIIAVLALPGPPPRFLTPITEVVLTVVCMGGLLGLFLSLLRVRHYRSALHSSAIGSWRQLGFLIVPFSLAYCLLLLSAAGTTHSLYDRYALGLLPLILICVIRYYQQQINLRVPLTCLALIGIMCLFGISATQQSFAIHRARVALAEELHAEGVPETSIDGGWEYNLVLELQYADHLNDPLLKTAADGYVPRPPERAGPCQMSVYDYIPHIRPIYSISFDPNACYGAAPFAPVHYSRWPYRTPGTLYVVRFTPAASE